MSWKVHVELHSGEIVGNGLRFPTEEQALGYATDLEFRWTAVKSFKVLESPAQATHRFLERNVLPLESTLKQNEERRRGY